MYKKIILLFSMSFLFLLGFSFSTYAETYEYVVDGGEVLHSNGGLTRDVLTVSTTNPNIKFYINCSSSSISSFDEIGSSSSIQFNLYYCILNDDGTITYGGSPLNNSNIQCTLERYQFGILTETLKKNYVYCDSGCVSDVPWLAYCGNEYGPTDNGMSILEDYFIYGKGAYYEPVPTMPEFDEEHSVENSSLGYLTKLHAQLVFEERDKGNSVDNYINDDNYHYFTWVFKEETMYASGAAVGPPQFDGTAPDGCIYKVQIQSDLFCEEGSIFGLFGDKKRYYVRRVEHFNDFSDFPSVFASSYKFTYLDMVKLGRQNYENNITDSNGEKITDDVDLSESYFNSDYTYFRIIRYNPELVKYEVSPTWYRIRVDSDGVTYDGGKFDEDGNFNVDGSAPSYTGKSDGTLNDDAPDDFLNDKDKSSLYDENKNSGLNWSWDNIDSVLDFFMDLPQLLALFFSFVPSVVWWTFAGVLLVVVAMRILGR